MGISISGVVGSIFFTGNLLYGAMSDFSPGDGLTENNVSEVNDERFGPIPPAHGGYCEQKTRTMIITNPEGTTHLFHVGVTEMIGQLRAMLLGSRFVTSKDFKLLYRGQEVLSNGAAKVEDEGEYLVGGDSIYTIEYTTLNPPSEYTTLSPSSEYTTLHTSSTEASTAD